VRAPADPHNEDWIEFEITNTLDGPESLWAGDLDGDGRVDLVTGEMGTSDGYGDLGSNLLAFEADSADGLSWSLQVLADGIGISARATRVDIGGDVDFTTDGNAEDHIYLWVNETSTGGAPPNVPALPPAGSALLAIALVALGARGVSARRAASAHCEASRRRSRG
jgi:hypothetical protein